jgi:hypothetical protein
MWTEPATGRRQALIAYFAQHYPRFIAASNFTQLENDRFVTRTPLHASPPMSR